MKKLICALFILSCQISSARAFCGFEDDLYSHLGFRPKEVKGAKKVKVAVIDLYIPKHRCRQLIDFDSESLRGEIGRTTRTYLEGPRKFHGLEMTLTIKALAPQAEIKFFSIKDMSDEGISKVFNRAINWGADVINYSIESLNGSYYPKEHQAFKLAEKKNITIVGAAGNDGENLENYTSYPSKYRVKGLENVFIVSTKELIGNFSPKEVLFETFGRRVPTASVSVITKKTTTGSSVSTAIVTGVLSYLMGQKDAHSQEDRLKLLKSISIKSPLKRSFYGVIDFRSLNSTQRDLRDTFRTSRVEKLVNANN